MSRCAALKCLVLAVGLTAGSPFQVLGQDATSRPDSGLEYTTADRRQAGTITLRKVDDPFTAFLPGSPPGYDQRYVQLTVRFQAADDRPFDAQPSQIVIQDSQGFLYEPSPIDRPPDSLPPTLENQPLAPGDRVTGAIGYVLPRSTGIDEVSYRPTPTEDKTILYRPTSGARLLPILDRVHGSGPAIGTEVSDSSPDGTQAGMVTVRGVTDPFTPYVPTGSPSPGSPGPSESQQSTTPSPNGNLRYVLVDVVFEAAEDKTFQSAPWLIVIHDTDGNQWGYAELSLPPDSPSRQVANRRLGPDDRISGVVGFAIPAAAVIDEVLYEPPYAVRRVPLASLAGE